MRAHGPHGHGWLVGVVGLGVGVTMLVAFPKLEPGARFLAVLWVPGWTMFAVANVVCFMLTTPAGWRRLAGAAGFTLRDQGTFNGMWYMLLEKPRG